MPEFTRSGPNPEPVMDAVSHMLVAGRATRPRRAFHPAAVVLEYQHDAIQGLFETQRARSSDALPISMRGRFRLVELAMQVLAHSVAETEAECRAIVWAAEEHAAAIVSKAYEEVERLLVWAEPGDVEAVPTPTSEAIDTAGPNSIVTAPAERPEDVEASFFDTPLESDEDAWRFMDDDLVSVGASLRKLVRRRPSRSPQADENQDQLAADS